MAHVSSQTYWLQHRAAPASPDRRRHAPEPAGAGSFGDLRTDRASDRPLGASDERLGVEMETGGVRRLNRSSPSCLNTPAHTNRLLPRAAKMMRDELRLSIRLLRKHPGWTTASILTLTLGLGAATLTLGVLDHVLWRPLDFPRGHELFTLYVRSGPEYSAVSYSDFLDFRAALQREGELAAFCRISATIDGGAFSQYHEGELVSGAFFTVLGIAPYMGRFITASDNATAGAHPVIVLSHMLWRGSFGGDPAIVGKSVRVNGRPYAVIGVAPAGFRGAVWPTYQTAFWIPAAMAGDILGRDRGILTNRRLGIFQTVGRRYAGRSAEVLQATLDPLDASLRSVSRSTLFPGHRLTVASDGAAGQHATALAGVPWASDARGSVVGVHGCCGPRDRLCQRRNPSNRPMDRSWGRVAGPSGSGRDR